MRPRVLATMPLLAALTAIPATAQVRAEVRLGIPIGNHQVMVAVRPERMPREVRIYDYDRRDYGDWDRDRDYRRWQPITVYFYAGRYYERPFRYARPVVIYRYRDRYFFPPRDGRWERAYGRDNDWGRGYGRDRDDRYGRDRDDRYGRDRDDRNDRDRDDRYYDRGDRYQNDRGVPPIRGGRSRP